MTTRTDDRAVQATHDPYAEEGSPENAIFLVALVLLPLMIMAFVYGLVALATGPDVDTWTQINNQCYVHTTQDRNVWLTPGYTHSAQRTVLCPSTQPRSHS